MCLVQYRTLPLHTHISRRETNFSARKKPTIFFHVLSLSAPDFSRGRGKMFYSNGSNFCDRGWPPNTPTTSNTGWTKKERRRRQHPKQIPEFTLTASGRFVRHRLPPAWSRWLLAARSRVSIQRERQFHFFLGAIVKFLAVYFFHSLPKDRFWVFSSPRSTKIDQGKPESSLLLLAPFFFRPRSKWGKGKEGGESFLRSFTQTQEKEGV